jgi:Cyclic nucleotide-binding domain
MLEFLKNPFIFLHIGGLISVTALALKDQLKLRSVLLVSILFTAIFHMRGEHGPVWQELLWNGVEFSINGIVLTQLVLDRTHIGLTGETEELFNALKFLSPGEFRALLRLAKWETAEDIQVITTEGVAPKDLFYVLKGRVHIEKAGREFTIEPRTFIGEVAFLHSTSASATVRLDPGARYLRWPVQTLERGLQSKENLRIAVMRLISLDTATKLARA